ncbi:hypothetical protein TIFTF001_002272 [Ficus carica]|uniref:MLO-like protein n=1 Tax=Ficus carica TaxID=3494 RepID=A0AA87ZT10_FICCA|nr:hypothetical protein TIFTF001_002272 [Ficus carica]
MEDREGRSLEETPTWAFATVVTVMVSLGFFFHVSLKLFGKWLDKTRRKSLLAALEKIKEEVMLFGVLSLLMGHWIVVVAKICVKTTALSSRFFPCTATALEGEKVSSVDDLLLSRSEFVNKTVFRKRFPVHEYCSELHRLIFVLGMTHVFYSFAAIALAMLKIYSWRVWENEAKAIANQSLEDHPEAQPNCTRMRRMSTFIDQNTSHSWSQHKSLVWLLCFSRQFWSSIHRSDYMALRLGFITTHQLPLSYDFHNYMLRSMEEEFRDIVGISIPLWIYAICCIFLDFHGSNIYFWLSFLPAILILLIGTKLHRVVVKLAVEIMDNCPYVENRQFKLRDELFWFGKPRLLLLLIQLISFQNAFEMATFIWSLWEIKEPSCFMDNRRFLLIRLLFGVISQFWCSFITFPLYVIITQMGTRFKRTVIAESVRTSLSGWKRRVKARHAPPHTTPLLSSTPTTTTATTSSDSVQSGTHKSDNFASTSAEGSSSGVHDTTSSPHNHGMSQFPFLGSPRCDSFSSNDSEIRHRSVNSSDVTSP